MNTYNGALYTLWTSILSYFSVFVFIIQMLSLFSIIIYQNDYSTLRRSIFCTDHSYIFDCSYQILIFKFRYSSCLFYMRRKLLPSLYECIKSAITKITLWKIEMLTASIILKTCSLNRKMNLMILLIKNLRQLFLKYDKKLRVELNDSGNQ